MTTMDDRSKQYVGTDDTGVPYRIAQSAETRGRRLHIDGEPFPWATSGGQNVRAERDEAFTILWVPVVVEGPVTITPAPYRSTEKVERLIDAAREHPVDDPAERADLRPMVQNILRALGRMP